ncbi:mini-chromosome maintenance complex-binding protein-like [Dendronephthya gigantea]|uniref:mini-chromosome maintenance complex-binding protein-like n=1 Tax=Dendronephthya gigantea TaxID=151771 RepID=UPI00106DA388|nr:mini-chromosome maintenance complex-binding protein-like [Dendronephthya gigantea]XP_028406865.1 mini-chromosome maintenance complex-binding protein-like [Dendronephthya gigantea]
MPCIEEWMSNPLLLIDQKMEFDDECLIKQVKDYFSERIQQKSLDKIQSLNDKSLDHIKPNTLVRFRCMIQDMFEPEYYLSRYETIETDSGTKEKHLGLYRDVASCKPGQQINMDCPQNKTRERQCFYCVPIPAETTWAKKAYAKAASPSHCQSGSVATAGTSGMLKRSVDELQESITDGECFPNQGSTMAEDDQGGDNKKTKWENDQEMTRTVSLGNADLNFPLPDEKGSPCIIKIYDDSESYKVNDIVEFVGILSVDPQLTHFQNQGDQMTSPFDVMEVEEDDPHSLPSSIVPRIHAVLSFKLEHSNPCLSSDLAGNENLFSEVSQVRETLLNAFENILCGDPLAAEYLLLHLLSTVYSRPDVLALGKYALNLVGCSNGVAKEVYKIVEYLSPKCCAFPMTIENLNKSKLVPKKDYKTNRLTSGKLQLSDNTRIVIDETALEEGQLDNNGVQNIAAINHLISWQKLQYDFGFYKTDFFTNVVILILSEGKSLLQADSRIQIVSKKPPVSFEKICQNFDETFVNNVRKYLGLARLIKYEISHDAQKFIEEDFVQMRQANPSGISVERFHSLLSLARLVALSRGRKHLLKEDWIRTKHIEELRQDSLTRGRSNP